jgi:competence protein ComEC
VGKAWLAEVIDAQRLHLALWVPVLFASGIGVYFSIPSEPQRWMLAALATALTMLIATLPRVGGAARILLMTAIMPGAGFFAAAIRSSALAAPILPYEMTAAVEGRILGLDRSGSDRPRILLDRVIIHGLEAERTPERIRISVEDSTPVDVLRPGLRLLGQARISPPAAPSEPGGFDFRRLAWFARIGAVGYTRTPMLEMESDGARRGWRGTVFALRVKLSHKIKAAIPGENGGFAAAILTGDRAGVDPAALAALRASNLAHLLAISGLHMGLLTGFVFALVRYGLALFPPIALRLPTKKIAAVVALLAGAGYLVLSGANVATERAFIMTAVVLVAVLIDRPAFTLRSVALAALVVLSTRPESLIEAGFQMSFAATTVLIATFEWLRGRAWWREMQSERWRYLRPVIGVAVTSFVAGAATAPISAFHFNVVSQYGLIANILAVPAMGLVVMPAAVLAGIAGVFGLAAPALWAMDAGIGYILQVAAFVSDLEGAVRSVPAAGRASLVLIVLGGLFWVLWIGRARVLGLLPILLGLALWTQVDRPDILITEDGRLFGIRTPGGRVLSSEKSNGFAATQWMQNDGDPADQAAAYARAVMERSKGRVAVHVSGLGRFVYLGTKSPSATTMGECRTAAVLLAPNWNEPPPGDCLFIGSGRLRSEGALALRIAAGRLELEGARSLNRGRPWTRSR